MLLIHLQIFDTDSHGVFVHFSQLYIWFDPIWKHTMITATRGRSTIHGYTIYGYGYGRRINDTVNISKNTVIKKFV